MVMDLTDCDDQTVANHYRMECDDLRARNEELRQDLGRRCQTIANLRHELYQAKRCIKVCRDQAAYLHEHHASPEADVMFDAIREFLNVNKRPEGNEQ